jgi:regulator of RNase E activity RraA
MVIEPGDLVIGDEDGLLCVPFDQTGPVFKAATAKFEAEQKQILISRPAHTTRLGWTSNSAI